MMEQTYKLLVDQLFVDLVVVELVVVEKQKEREIGEVQEEDQR